MEKRYEEALERARKGMSMDEIFPELKESEDERIRKELIEYLTHKAEVTGFVDEDRDCKRWIAYLEKQKDEAQKQFNLGMQAGREEVVYEMEKEQQLTKCNKDERIRKEIVEFLTDGIWRAKEISKVKETQKYAKWIDYLEKQKEHKPVEENERETEINLVKILKHYPKETELYSPLYGKLWLAKVDERNGVITCYRYPLDEGCTRAILEQEDTVSFYSNGTTGLPDFSVSEDCMLFLYDTERRDEQKPVEWSEEDEKNIEKLDSFLSEVYIYGRAYISQRDKDELQNWLKSFCPQPHTVPVENATKFGNLEYDREVKDGIQSEKSRHWKPSEKQMGALKNARYMMSQSGDYYDTTAIIDSLITELQKLL